MRTAEQDLERFARYREESERAIEGEGLETDLALQDAEADALWRRPADTLRAFPAPKARFMTPWPSLNKATRGRGIPTNAVVVVQGETDAGKTSMALQFAVHLAQEYGAKVWIYSPDGGEVSTAVRAGGLLGFDLDRLENRDPEEIVRLEQAMRDLHINIVTDSSELANLELVIKEAEEISPDTPHILALDSVQETPPSAEAQPSERDAVIANVRLLRKARQSKVPWLVIATSEIVKSAFSAKKDALRSRKIAAGSETGKIGYLATVVIHLSGNPAVGPNYGRADVVKNKLGPKLSYGLKVQEATLALSEIDYAAGAEEDSEKAKAIEDADRMAMERKVLAAIDSDKPRAGYPGISEAKLVKACGVSRRNTKLWAAVDSLKCATVIEELPGRNDSTCYRRRVG
jgi:hypothetical protein